MTEIEDEVMSNGADEIEPSQDIPRSAGIWHKYRWLLVTGLVIAVIVSGALIVVRGDKLPDDAVLRLGDTTVTKAEYSRRVDALSALYGVVSPEGGEQEQSFRRDAAKSIAVSMILDEAARELNIVVGHKEAQSALDKIIDEQLPGGRTDFVQFLSTSAVSEDEVLEEVKRQLATSRLFETITSEVAPVTEDAVREYYDAHTADMTTAERRRISNIVTGSEREANQVLQRARAGEDFADLATRFSLDGSTKTRGGDLGWVTADQLDAAFGQAAFAATNGVPFGPAKSQFGWNVGVVTAVDPAKPLTFEQVSQQLRTDLEAQRELDVWRDWLADQIKDADVEYADAYRPTDPDAPPADLPTTAP